MPNEEILNDLDELRGSLDQCLNRAQAIADKIARGTGGREVALGITWLQQAGHWFRGASEILNVEHLPLEAYQQLTGNAMKPLASYKKPHDTTP